MPTVNPVTLAEADFQTEVNDLIMHVTGLEQSRLFRGNQSREVLPATGDYCIYTPIVRKRIGTNVTEFDAKGVPDEQNGVLTDSELVQQDVQVDFYGPDALKYAQGLELFVHSTSCRAWLVQMGYSIRVLHSTAPVDVTRVGDTRQYIPRWMITVSLCFKSSLMQGVPWYEDFKLGHIKNVDVYFKP